MKTILVDAVHTFVIVGQGIDQEMYDLLETYPNRKILLTGANSEQMQEFGLIHMPYEVFSLHHNPEKTDSEYFRKMLDHFELNAEDVVYFEHNADAVQSAISVDITSFWYDREQRDLIALKNFLDTNL